MHGCSKVVGLYNHRDAIPALYKQRRQSRELSHFPIAAPIETGILIARILIGGTRPPVALPFLYAGAQIAQYMHAPLPIGQGSRCKTRNPLSGANSNGN